MKSIPMVLGVRRGEEGGGGGAVSLGLGCTSDDECRAADPYSRCRRNRCDCIHPNSTCSAINTGCHRATFQCRSSGKCISWYLVCDGRWDCDDGSDEECRGGEGGCPRTAFRCSRSRPLRLCVSAARRCDGIPDCPAAEDEANCRDTANRGCPRSTYRCGDGRCLPGYEFCNAIVSCGDGSDEPGEWCRLGGGPPLPAACPFTCRNGLCRSSAIACSGRDGCGDNSDETNCQVCKCPKA